jgi:hypothetical protein
MPDPRGGGKTVPFSHQEPIGRKTQGGVMMETAPASSFKVPEPQFLLEFLIVAFDDPAVLGQAH